MRTVGCGTLPGRKAMEHFLSGTLRRRQQQSILPDRETIIASGIFKRNFWPFLKNITSITIPDLCGTELRPDPTGRASCLCERTQDSSRFAGFILGYYRILPTGRRDIMILHILPCPCISLQFDLANNLRNVETPDSREAGWDHGSFCCGNRTEF